MKRALRLLPSAYKMLNLTHHVSIVLFFRRVCLSRGWKSELTQGEDFGV